LFDVNFQPEGMTVEELEKNFRWLAQELYSEKATKERQHHFYQQLRQVVKSEQLHRRTQDESTMD